MDAVHFAAESDLDPGDLLAFYRAQQHPSSDSEKKIRHMLERSASIVTARDADGRLIGVARGLTDGVHGYLTECKLDPRFQGPAAVTRTDGRIEHDALGIARELATRVIAALSNLGCDRIHCIAYGTEVDFCEELGFKRNSGMAVLTLAAARTPQTAAKT